MCITLVQRTLGLASAAATLYHIVLYVSTYLLLLYSSVGTAQEPLIAEAENRVYWPIYVRTTYVLCSLHRTATVATEKLT